MMKKLITQSDAAAAEEWNFVDLPNTRAWHPVTVSPRDERRWLLGTTRYALAALVAAGGVAVLAAYQRSMNRDA
jgi:hypothetical protein